MARRFSGYWLGRQPYAEVHALMHQLFEARRVGAIGDTILLLEHDPVITLGRGTQPPHLLATSQELVASGVEVVSTGRGGDITLHAPGQLVAYPILDLSPDRRDVRRYVKDLAEVMRLCSLDFGVASGLFDRYVGLWTDGDNPSVWPGAKLAKSPAKIGAIGVKISRWITMHGFALNLSTDLGWYRLIVPCGITEYPVATIAGLTGKDPAPGQVAARAFEHFCSVFRAEDAGYEENADNARARLVKLAEEAFGSR